MKKDKKKKPKFIWKGMLIAFLILVFSVAIYTVFNEPEQRKALVDIANIAASATTIITLVFVLISIPEIRKRFSKKL